jgi:hypothetical protein
VAQLRADLERIVLSTPIEPPIALTLTAPEVKEEEISQVVVEKEEKKSLIDWLDTLAYSLNLLLATSPSMAEEYVFALSNQVNMRLDEMNCKYLLPSFFLISLLSSSISSPPSGFLSPSFFSLFDLPLLLSHLHILSFRYLSYD